MALLRDDFRSSVWTRFEAELRDRLAELRELNDRMTHTNDDTLSIRGRIDEIKKLLALRNRSAGESAEPGDSWPPRPGA